MTQTRVTSEGATSIKELLPSDWPGASLWAIYLVHDCYRRVQTSVGSTTPGQVALGYIRKPAEQATGGNPVSVGSVSVLASDCLSKGLKSSSKINSFLPPQFSSMFFWKQLNPACALISHCHSVRMSEDGQGITNTLILSDKSRMSLRGAIFNDHD